MIAIIQSMPRRSRDEKAKSHERIVDIASARIRELGTTAPGVAEIMKEAGLTHGGFYKHFDSRDDLIAEAVGRMFAESQSKAAAVVAHADDPLTAFVDWYVSPEHRDNPGSGCGVVALGADAGRGDARVRAAYTEQVKRYLDDLVQLSGHPDPETRRQATVTLCTLVGAVLVARGVDDPDLSDEIIRDVRAAFASTDRNAPDHPS
jgi:TetR/AcrR family transcriptional regulator, transcriptional repressor for nem operon